MATFDVKVRHLDAVEPHPNADRLELAVVGDYRAVVAKGQFQAGDAIAYLPEASVLPAELIAELGLTGKLAGPDANRVHAVRLRGALSQGVVMAARAAGKQPIGGIWQQIKDLEGLAKASAFDRQLGMSGELALHPMQVETINRSYTPTADDIAYYQGMIDALDAAQKQGRASVMYDGEHIDIAHVKTAREFIALAQSFNN